MIAIPNMEKPKGCGKCEVWSLCHYPKVDGGYDDKVMPDCPLLDIVQCWECKYRNKSNRHCDGGGADVNIIVSDDHFCSYGERRSE